MSTTPPTYAAEHGSRYSSQVGGVKERLLEGRNGGGHLLWRASSDEAEV